MDFNAFPPSSEPGGLRNTNEIKILICYLLKSVGSPVSYSQLNHIFQSYSLVNYFELTKAISDLLHTKHIIVFKTVEKTDYYINTKLGDSTADDLSHDIPLSVKDKALSGLKAILKKAKNEAENQVSISKVPDGFVVTCKIKDIGTDLLSFDLFVANELEANRIKDNFLNDPSSIYRGLLALLTKDSNII